MMRLGKLLAIGLIFFFILVSSVQAIGITPARVTVDFEPGMEGVKNFCVINNQKKSMGVELFVDGGLAEYIELSATRATMNPAEYSKCFSYIYSLPDRMEPGTHEARIGVTEIPPESVFGGTGISTRASVLSQFRVFVPPEGSHIQIERILTNQAEVGHQVTIKLLVRSIGTEDTEFYGDVKISDSNNINLGTLTVPKTLVTAGAVKIVELKWGGSTIPGRYSILASLTYDEGVATSGTAEIKIGGEHVDIIAEDSMQVALDDISNFILTVENFWSEEIEDVSGRIVIQDSTGKTIEQLSIDSFDLKALGSKNLNLFWDSRDAAEGEYLVTVVLDYLDGKVSTKKITLSIGAVSAVAEKTSLDAPSQELVATLSLLLIVLVILTIIYVAIRKK